MGEQIRFIIFSHFIADIQQVLFIVPVTRRSQGGNVEPVVSFLGTDVLGFKMYTDINHLSLETVVSEILPDNFYHHTIIVQQIPPTHPRIN